MSQETVAHLLAAKPGQHVVAVAPDATVTYAVCLMNHHDVGAVLVMEGERLVGIFTERDVLRRVIEPGLDPSITRIHEVHSESPQTIAGDALPEAAVNAMVDGNFRHIPVTENSQVCGILSMRDLTEWLLQRRQGGGERTLVRA